MKIKSPSNRSKKMPTAIILVASILVASLGAAAYFYFQRHPTPQLDGQTVNMKKSTAEEKLEKELIADPTKKTSVQSDTPSQPPIDSSSGKQTVNVVITDAGVYDGNFEARGFITNSVEQTGVCTYTLTQGSTVIEKKAQPLQNATSTTCETVKFSVGELNTGTWSVILEYNSSLSYGKSSPREFIVP